jgi:hypothetical protein
MAMDTYTCTAYMPPVPCFSRETGLCESLSGVKSYVELVSV